MEALVDACRTVRATLPGGRYDACRTAAWHLGPLVRGGFLDEQTARDALRDAADDAGAEDLTRVDALWPGALRREPAVVPGAEFTADPTPTLISRPYVWRDPNSIPPREWVYGGHYIKKFVSATVAPGGLGKSANALIEALDMVTGKGLLTGKPTARLYRVSYWNGEDPIEETERRIAAACLHFGIADFRHRRPAVVQSGRNAPIVMATEDRRAFISRRLYGTR